MQAVGQCGSSPRSRTSFASMYAHQWPPGLLPAQPVASRWAPVCSVLGALRHTHVDMHVQKLMHATWCGHEPAGAQRVATPGLRHKPRQPLPRRHATKASSLLRVLQSQYMLLQHCTRPVRCYVCEPPPPALCPYCSPAASRAHQVGSPACQGALRHLEPGPNRPSMLRPPLGAFCNRIPIATLAHNARFRETHETS